MRQTYIGYPIMKGQHILLDPQRSHHLKDVLRMKNGDKIRVVDSARHCYMATLSFDNGVSVLIDEEIENNSQNREIIYIAAMIKKDKWEMLLQKAAELGASRIVPLISKRCIIHLEEKEIDKKMQRWNMITQEACQQSNRSDLCPVGRPVTIQQIEQYKSEINLLAYEKEETEYITNKIDGSSSITFVCGPEGGFEKSEAEQLIEKGFVSVSLGKRILRAETAGLYALSVIDAKGNENEICDL